jgi:predicted DNA-binding WGR domain protein
MQTTAHHLHRVDPARNMARFYALSVEPTLFGPAALVCRWGRIGTHGQQCTHVHEDLAAAQAALERRLMGKLRRGYRPVVAPC